MEIKNDIKSDDFFSFFKQPKIIIFIILITFSIIFLTISFIKYGSNFFLWVIGKDDKNPKKNETPKSVEEIIKDVKNMEKFSIDMQFLAQNDNIILLEERVEYLNKELDIINNKKNPKNINNDIVKKSKEITDVNKDTKVIKDNIDIVKKSKEITDVNKDNIDIVKKSKEITDVNKDNIDIVKKSKEITDVNKDTKVIKDNIVIIDNNDNNDNNNNNDNNDNNNN